jgi:hypothetical protein
VRRRLFQPLPEPNYVSRDNTASVLRPLPEQSSGVPGECREADYERKLKAAYPIHPEIFGGCIRTGLGCEVQRAGVLRLMAVIHRLWEATGVR